MKFRVRVNWNYNGVETKVHVARVHEENEAVAPDAIRKRLVDHEPVVIPDDKESRDYYSEYEVDVIVEATDAFTAVARVGRQLGESESFDGVF